ncbi:MAG: hypothetical protein AB7Q01_12270 [Gammaproteobacteria bacterium]
MPESPDFPILKGEDSLAFNSPAIFSNRCFAYVTAQFVRISFSEQHSLENPPAVRSSVIMPMADAEKLVELLQALIADAKKKADEVAIKSSPEKAGG